MRWSIPDGMGRLVFVTLALLAAATSASCGDVGPEECTGTCIVIVNQSHWTITDAYFRGCSDVLWGDERLLEANRWDLEPGEQEEWPVTPGCWDILVQAPGSGMMLQQFEDDVEISANERHVCTVTFPGAVP